MSQLLIRNLPEALHCKLKERARKHRRSLSNEVVILLEQALIADTAPTLAMPEPFVGKFAIDDHWINAAKQEDRA